MVLQPLLVQRGFTMPKCGLLVPTRGAEEAAMDLLSPEEDAVEDLKRRMVGTKNDIQQRLLTNSWRFSWQTQLAKNRCVPRPGLVAKNDRMFACDMAVAT
jgi:hypothetical protein